MPGLPAWLPALLAAVSACVSVAVSVGLQLVTVVTVDLFMVHGCSFKPR